MMKHTFLFTVIAACFSLCGVDITGNGKAVADIAIPENPVSSVRFAAEELQKFIRLVSGAELEIVSCKAPRKHSNRIFVGCGAAPADKTPFAWRVKADKNDLYLHGNDREVYSDKIDFHEKIIEWGVTSCGSLLAVYEFLDKELGIRYLRPGDVGIIAPSIKSISFKPFDRENKPRLESVTMAISDPSRRPGGWKDKVWAQNFVNDCRIWMLRHGMVNTYWHPSGHAFTNYWKRFGKTNPEYFALLPDGTRRPLKGNPRGHYIAMCISDPGFQDRFVSEWSKTRSRWHKGRWNWIAACENDVPGLCVCKNCRAWDGPEFDPAGAAYWGDKRIPDSDSRFTMLGIDEAEPSNKTSLTDRYCRFYLEILKKARKYNPAVSVFAYAYGNFTNPPQSVKLNKNIMISYVGTPIFPMDAKKMAESKARWQGWAKAGCLLGYRPNSTHAYGCMPLQYTAQLAGEYRMVLHTPGLRRVHFDALQCEFASQGLMYYTLARLTQYPEKTLDEISDEYFSVFGKAAPAVRRYYRKWQEISDSVSWEKDVEKWEKETGMQLNVHTAADFCASFIRMNCFDESAEILAAAARAADTARAKSEVKFLQTGLEHARLTLAMHVARLKNLNEPSQENLKSFKQAQSKLHSFRAAHEKMGISNMARLYGSERYGATWSKPRIKK